LKITEIIDQETKKTQNGYIIRILSRCEQEKSWRMPDGIRQM